MRLVYVRQIMQTLHGRLPRLPPPAPPAVSVNWFAFTTHSPPLVNSGSKNTVTIQSTNTITALTVRLGHGGNYLSRTEQ